jgi:hypothetical protein
MNDFNESKLTVLTIKVQAKKPLKIKFNLPDFKHEIYLIEE